VLCDAKIRRLAPGIVARRFPMLGNTHSRTGAGTKGARLPMVLFAGLYLAHGALLLVSAASLPERVATHFDRHGIPNGWMGIRDYVTFSLLFGAGFPLFIVAVSWAVRFAPGGLNVPHRQYWLGPERREEVFAGLLRDSWWFACMIMGISGRNALPAHPRQPREPRAPFDSAGALAERSFFNRSDFTDRADAPAVSKGAGVNSRVAAEPRTFDCKVAARISAVTSARDQPRSGNPLSGPVLLRAHSGENR
jgi:hypothetical protein